jgi:hypothetical protein
MDEGLFAAFKHRTLDVVMVCIVLEPLNICVDLFIILGEMGVIWSTSILEAKALWAGVQ